MEDWCQGNVRQFLLLLLFLLWLSEQVGEDVVAKVESFKTADFAAMLLPKMEYLVSEDEQTGEVQCDCQWGLFRDRNVTLR